jgi:excinuclease UvrABC nuclease subunit
MKSQDLVKFNLPSTPGVYFWKKGKDILYIGKATILRDRVRSYFANDLIDTRGPNILDMVTQSDDIEYQETPSVLEALILEANLIKKHQPKYNTKEKDNKSFYKVIISDESWPRIIMVRSRDLQVMEITGRISRIKFEGGIKYSFGPFPNGGSLRDALKIIRKIFPFRDFRADTPENERFYKQLGLSPDTSDTEARKEYQKNIRNIVLFFQGKKGAILKQLEKEMKTNAEKLLFEQANISKRKIFALTHINDVALIKDDRIEDSGVVSGKTYRIESYDIAHISGQSMVGVMTVVMNGFVDKASYRKFKIMRGANGDVHDIASLEEILVRRLGHTEWLLPNLLVVDGGMPHYEAAKRILINHNVSIDVVAVVKDERHRPREILGDEKIILKHKKSILLANSESHRFAITYHKQVRAKKFLGK